MKFVLTCCCLLIISSCYKVEEKATTASMQTPDSYLWDGSFPKNIYYASALPTLYQTDTESMIAKWNALFPAITFFNSVTSTPISDKFADTYTSVKGINDNFNTVYLVDDDNWPTSSSAALGVAILLGRINKNEQYVIEEVDILIKSDRTHYDSRTIILHELGHFLGLQHLDLGYSRKLETVMYPEISTLDIKHDPQTIDIKTLAKLYDIPYGPSAKIPRKKTIPEGQGQLQRMMIELNADMNCRHYLEGVEIHSHKVDL